MNNKYILEQGVANNGWQNPFIYNARYAVVIGGGGLTSVLNVSAFRNDIEAMYNKLTENNYLDENIYCFLWDSQCGDLNGKVDGPSVWKDDWGFAHEMFPTSIFIQEGLAAIEQRITKNDFFFFAEICHGNKKPEVNDAIFKVGEVYKANGTLSFTEKECTFGPTGIPSGKPSLGIEIDTYIKWYSRALFVFQSCGASSGISRIAGENRIVITAQNHNVDPWVVADPKEGDTWTELAFDHWAFIYEGNHRWFNWNPLDFGWKNDIHPGFIRSMGIASSPESVLHAFNCGYDAATNNYEEGGADGRSHPMLEDYFGNGNTGSQGQLSPSNDSDEGWLAEHTYL